MGNIVVSYIKDGLGNFHRGDDSESVPLDTFDDLFENRSATITSDGKYLVNFETGDWRSLARRSENHGYYIDVWEIGDEGEEEDTAPTRKELLELALKLSEELKAVVEKVKRLDEGNSK